MAHVIVLDSLSEDIFVCGICKLVFNCMQTFLEHKSLKCNIGTIGEAVVSSCVKQATVTSDIMYEDSSAKLVRESSDYFTNMDKQEKKEECTPLVYKKQFPKKTSSLMKVHYEKPYQCLICGRSFIQNSHLRRHIDSHKVWPYCPYQTTAKSAEADLLSYSCPHCNLVLPDYSQFRIHLKMHSTLKKFKCIQGNCMDYYDTVESLIEHVNSSHHYVFYSCHMCNTGFNSLEELATHQVNHKQSTNEKFKRVKILKCPQCDAEFHKPEKLSMHLVSDDHKKVCIHCSKIFTSEKRLRLHLQIHRQIKPFQCTICGNSFHMKKYLTSHMLRHGVRQFQCTICRSMFKRNDLLQRHMKLHQAKKIFKCPFKESLDCKREFSRSDKLKSHIKIHTKTVLTNTNKVK